MSAHRTSEQASPGYLLSERNFDRLKMAHDASHYLLVPQAVATPTSAQSVAEVFARCRQDGRSLTFRSGGTSLSGQAITDGVLIDTRKNFRSIEVLDDGARVRVEPGATVRQVNAHLARHGRKLGPDPASEIACTIGGVVANNSSGMTCGTEQNTYRTLESLVVVLASGTILDSAAPDADAKLAELEPALHAGLTQLRERILADPESVATITRLFRMKNTMGYGINSFLDFETPIDILMHLMIGSEGTLGFVAEATFRTVPVLPWAATGLAIFPDLSSATGALPQLVASGFATIELLDATSLRVAQRQQGVPAELEALDVASHAALLVELTASDAQSLASQQSAADAVFAELDLVSPVSMTSDPMLRADLWHIRKGLYTAVAEARPSGTTALLEDIVVPVPALLRTCESLIDLFETHGYRDSVIFGHAKDGNIHFMLNESWEEPGSRERYKHFTQEMVDLVLANGGSLKAEHGTGRIMAPFVRRQYGDELYEVMSAIKALFDPDNLLNPGVVLSDDPDSYLDHLKTVPTVEEEVDRCVECGYCEPVCPSKDLTTTPRQRIVIRREMRMAEESGNTALLDELRNDYDYEGTATCAVDGMCQVACPVSINTGDLTRRLRQENIDAVSEVGWNVAAKNWNAATRLGSAALTAADVVPAPLPIGLTRLGRAALGSDTVPLYGRDLPRGGSVRRAGGTSTTAQAVFFPACIGTLFGAAGSRSSASGTTAASGVTHAFLELCARSGIDVVVPEQISSMCCGTPWKSKGLSRGYATMTDSVLPALWAASDHGRLPIVCDAASCTEGLETMRNLAASASEHDRFSTLRFVDAIEFVHDQILPGLTTTTPLGSVALHHTCSSTQLGTNAMMTAIAQHISDDVFTPVDWQCCAFAGDRGLLHPELTASATAREAAEVNERRFAAYASTNRTCELGMTRATGHEYQHLLELLEVATRPALG